MGIPVGEPGIDSHSFHLGMCCAFIEAVGLGAKRLALSPPMRAGELEAVRPRVETFADEFGVLTRVEREPLVTRLFDPGFTTGREVILLARDAETFAEYDALKSAAHSSARTHRSEEAEIDRARRFGRLLSYSEEAIDRLLEQPLF